MRIIIEIDGAGSDAVRVLNTAAVAATPAAAGDAATTLALSMAQLTATNAGPAPGRDGSAPTAAAPGAPAMDAEATSSLGIAAGAAPNVA